MSATAANPSHALGLVVADELVRGGVTDVVVCPGSRSTAVAMAVDAEPRLRAHVHPDERSAGFVALGLGAVTGRPAAVVTTSGSAVANLHPAVVEADHAGRPLLLVTCDRPPELRDVGANQTLDQPGFFGASARWSTDLGPPEDRPGAVARWRATLARAVLAARGVAGPAGVPGPVQLNLAFREPTVPASDDGRSRAEPFTQDLTGRRDGAPWTGATGAPRRLGTAAVERLAERIAGTERGLVVVGGEVADPGAVALLAERAGWPLHAEGHSGARSGPCALHHGALLVDTPGFAARHRPDLVVRVGRPGLARGLAGVLAPEVPQVAVDAHGRWHDPHHGTEELVVADVGTTCRAVAAVLAAPAGSDWLDAWRRADDRATAVVADLLDDGAVHEPAVVRDVAAGVPSSTPLVVASSLPIRDLDVHLAPREGLRVVANRGVSGIDGFVSTALGVALGAGPATAVAGDLSLLHDANGFLLSPDASSLDATIVVLDNDGGGLFHLLPQAGYASFERLFGTPHGRDLEDLARFHRIPHSRVEHPGELHPTLDAARIDGGLHLVEVRTDREVEADLRRRIRAGVAASLA